MKRDLILKEPRQARRLEGWRKLTVRDGAPDSASALPGERLLTMRRDIDTGFSNVRGSP
jgi:hypothetical protein